ncbi:hypothetical protein OEA41_000795 [Lepraria neglecta]|uniref:Uncharacterized protein n=1 Tax=Lepraria neglecta TaxID=209136 RepID=A0AAD9ZIR4_9LECA|nr:hypothetical protein OEA41_000795 [Lepraria neglecta]
MLGPYFAEGQAANPSITLPEDDVEAMTWLCKALHFKLSANERLISFGLGRKLATLCDKYDTSVAISSWSAMWMQNWKGSVDGNISYAPLLYMSYAFGNHEAFWCTSRDIMQYYTTNEIKQIANELQSEILPYRLFDSINAERTKTLLRLQTTIEDMLPPFINDKCPEMSSCRLLTVAGYYLSELIRLGLWPLSRIVEQTSINTIASQIEHFENFDETSHEDEEDGWGGRTSSGGKKNRRGKKFEVWQESCSVPEIDCKKLLQDAASVASKALQGLCLNCIKEGKVTTEEGNCQARSQWDCQMQQTKESTQIATP